MREKSFFLQITVMKLFCETKIDILATIFNALYFLFFFKHCFADLRLSSVYYGLVWTVIILYENSYGKIFFFFFFFFFSTKLRPTLKSVKSF